MIEVSKQVLPPETFECQPVSQADRTIRAREQQQGHLYDVATRCSGTELKMTKAFTVHEQRQQERECMIYGIIICEYLKVCHSRVIGCTQCALCALNNAHSSMVTKTAYSCDSAVLPLRCCRVRWMLHGLPRCKRTHMPVPVCK